MRPDETSGSHCIFRPNATIDAARFAPRGRSSFEPMVFWILAIAITAIACAALYYAARGRPVNAPLAANGPAADAATTAHFRLQLKEIEGDIAAGRLGEAEGLAAKGEMARELLRFEAETTARPAKTGKGAGIFGIATLATAMLAFGLYGFLGNPQLPSLPLAERPPPAPEMDLTEAITRIEAQLAKSPDDVRGWTVIAPAYMQLGRFDDAATAFRRVIDLSGTSADRLTDLGEALMMANGGSAAGEPLRLFGEAATLDPAHVRSRFYIASEATRAGDFQNAVTLWTGLLALGKGDEAWVETARAGLDAARAGLNNDPGLPDDAAIRGMVDGLSTRLHADGGPIEDWTKLVRSRLVLGEVEAAQADYELAVAAYPDAAVRTELDVLAADNGLVMKKGTN